MNSYWIKYKARRYQRTEEYEESIFIHETTPVELEKWCQQSESWGTQKDFVITEIITIVKL